MKGKKRKALIAAFLLGAFLVAGSALADLRDKSGYEQLKDAVKLTATNGTENYQSFTAEVSTTLKDNGQVLYAENNLIKYDLANGAKEETTTIKDRDTKDGGRSLYRYSDKKQHIVKSSLEDNYIVTIYQDEKDGPLINKEDNPFNEERFKDMERILDALVGNLKDQVIVTENPDGGKTLSGKLSKEQIPALINALASFMMKQEFNGRRDGLINLASDVYIKEVWGIAKVNAEGSLENMMGTANISGLDKEGRHHEIGLEIFFQLSDVNTTKVVKPDLSREKVITRKERDFEKAHQPTPEKFLGRFKNDILIEKDGRFLKIGERHLEITLLDDKGIQGNYREELRAGYEKYAGPFQPYTFKARFGDGGDSNNATLEGMTEQGDTVKGSIYLDGYSAKIYLNINQNQEDSNVLSNTDFRPDLD
jgi:hypothetical protein